MKLKSVLLSAFFGLCPSLLLAATPEWIWHDNKGVAPAENEVRFFRKTFTLDGPVRKAVLTVAGDDRAVAYLNGKVAARNAGWNKAVSADVTPQLQPGENLLALRGQNNSGDAAVIAKLEITFRDDRSVTVVSDATWISSLQAMTNWYEPGLEVADWTKAISRGKLGVQPWGDVMAPPEATPASKLATLPGFKVELLHSATKDEGSWICLAVDPTGRLTIAPQDTKQPLRRITLSPTGQIQKMEALDVSVGGAMGLLYAFDSLYISGIGRNGTGLYRLRDTNGNDRLEDIQFLKKFDGSGEHGPHGIVLGPDKMLYLMHGNHTKLPTGLSPQSPHQDFAEDLLLPRQWDANGHARGILAPGGYVVRTDSEGKKWELLLAGFRNAYDLAFNQDGELFTYDSDMEWDWGMPWYRPTKIFHCVIGAEYGWRSGSGVWPEYYPDSLPGVVDLGIGSPTGVRFGTGAKFPAKYQQALYAMDWSYGRILAVHLTPRGASYTGTVEPFIVGKPLNVTDLEVGADGALYFITGGRGTQSGLYRVTYEETPSSAPVLAREEENKAAAARALRRQLEAFHGRVDPAAVDFVWPHLDSSDRWLRYAARIAIESQPVNQWQDRALAEKRVRGALSALLALARKSSKPMQEKLLESLGQFWPRRLDMDQKLEALRIAGLSFIRLGKPDAGTARDVTDALTPLFPSSDERLNREIANVLIYLEAPEVVQKCMARVAVGATQEDQLHYIFHLRTLKTGWTPDDRRAYFSWFNRARTNDKHPPELEKWFQEVGRSYSDGASFIKFMANIKKDAVDTLTEEERTDLAKYISGEAVTFAPVQQRAFVKEWTMEELVPQLDRLAKGRSFEKGRTAFTVAQCAACHRFGNEGGAVGPDITGAASRFNARDLLETIIEPSKVISDQYQNIVVFTKDDSDVVGRIIEEDEQKLVIRPNPLVDDTVTIKKAQVKSREPSKVSPMPEGLVNILTRDEILDLLAYIQSGGKRDHAAFR